MIWVDIVILGIIGISALISVVRGFMKEAISLAGWIVAIWAAMTFSGNLADALSSAIAIVQLRFAVAIVALVIGVLMVSATINMLMGQIVKKTGLSSTDRMIGIAFGATRGGLIVAALVLLGGLTGYPEEAWWNDSLLLIYFQQLAEILQGLLPQNIAEAIQF